MEVHAIGHASLLIKTNDMTILMDPVLWDPHQEGLFDVYPKREVIHDLLPKYNAMIVSHRHLDHFDIRSLAYLPKDIPVFIPRDPLIERYLKKLGYTKVELLSDFSEIKFGNTRIFTTRSENRVPEFGVVFADESGAVWNQVDTVVTPRTIEIVRSRISQIDLLIASWQPMMEDNFQMNRSLSFPYERYDQILSNIGVAAPAALVPGANAFCYTGASEWLNGVVFPLTRERFLHDVQIAAPSVKDKVFASDPGDVLVVQDGTCTIKSLGCEFVKRISDDRSKLAFSPVTVNGKLTDQLPDQLDEQEVETTIIASIENDLDHLLREKSQSFTEHQRWGVIYQLEVVLPHNKLSWVIDFSQPEFKVVRGQSPLANVFTYITGSSLCGLITRTLGWDYALLGGYYRTFKHPYHVTSLGLLRADKASMSDPLELLFPYQEILTSILDKEVDLWHRHTIASTGR